MATPRVTPDEWVDRFLAMPRDRQLLVARAVDTAVDQATHCYREHQSPVAPTADRPELDDEERDRILRTFQTMSDAVDSLLAEDDPEQRRDALRLFKTACASAIDYLTPELAVPLDELGGQS